MDEHDEAAERLNIKKVKMQFQQEIEAYIEEEKVHDIFQDMMTAIIKSRPKDPIDFLINHLNKPEKKRIIVVTPPGMKGGTDDDNICLMLEQHLKELHGQENMNVISVGDLLSKEITKRSTIGQKINEARKNYGYIPDEIVIKLVE
jgi:adenylate kinase